MCNDENGRVIPLNLDKYVFPTGVESWFHCATSDRKLDTKEKKIKKACSNRFERVMFFAYWLTKIIVTNMSKKEAFTTDWIIKLRNSTTDLHCGIFIVSKKKSYNF